MKTGTVRAMTRQVVILSAAAALVAFGLLSVQKLGYCDDDGYNMAPPVQIPSAVTSDPETATVFNWQEVPVNQTVPITRAVFDEGGYQLYDTVGETIVVRFKAENLYVMKFAVSSDGSTYFVNTGTSPVLYMPQDGYLENASVDGARWYPFGPSFDPSSPVFLGIADNWTDYTTIGWYPDMYCFGGYWASSTGGIFGPTVGLYIAFGGNRYNSWNDYRDYISDHPAPYHLGYVNHNIYHYASKKYWSTRTFSGNNARVMIQHNAPTNAAVGNLGRFVGRQQQSSPPQTFRGNQTQSDTSQGSHDNQPRSVAPSGGQSAHTFNGATHSFSGGSSGGASTRPFPGRSDGGARSSGGGGQSHGGDASSGGGGSHGGGNNGGKR